MSNQFQYGICQCCSEAPLCLLTCVVPCYTAGRNAEHFGEDCLMTGLLSLCLPLTAVLRWRLREQKNLEGSMIQDGVYHAFLPCCALVQEAREIGWKFPREGASERPQTETRQTDDGRMTVITTPPMATDQSEDMTRK